MSRGKGHRSSASRLHAFVCGRERFDAAVFDPFGHRAGTTIEIPYFFFVIEHPDAVIAFDTGPHPELVTNPAGRLGSDAAKWNLEVHESDLAAERIGSVGLTVSDVTHVVLSHLHYDHAGGIGQFAADAEYLVQRDELEFARCPPLFQADLYLDDDFAGVTWSQLDGQTDLMGDGAIILLPTPGHTAGHQSMLVRLADETVLLTADAAYTPEALACRTLPAGALIWRSDAMAASQSLLSTWVQREKATVVCSHDEHFRTRVRVAPDAFYGQVR